MKMLIAIPVALAVAVAGAQTTNQNQVRHVETALNHLTVLEFGEPVSTIAVADTDSFRVEHREDKVFIEPLREDIATNLFIWTESRQLTYELDPAGQLATMDVLIRTEPVPKSRSVAAASAEPSDVEIHKITSLVLAQAMMGVQDIARDGHRSVPDRVQVDLEQVYRAKDQLYIRYSITNQTKEPFRLTTPDVSARLPTQLPISLLSLRKGEREFLDRLLPHIEAAGRLQDLRVLDPTHPAESARYNPFYALDDAYQEHVNFIFRSFGLREDFFKGHQEAYLSDLVRILQYTGKLFNVYDVLVMALDENVLQEQIGIAKTRLASLSGVSTQKRLNFEMSVRMLQRSLADRERVEKIQGLLNELLSFLEDELSVVTGSYQDLLTLDDVFEQDLILFVSLNTNRNQRAVEALGKILLQNIQLMVGKRYARATGERDVDEPLLSVILDEFAPFAYPGFTQVLQTARGARVSFLFSFQSLPQLQRVSQAFSDEVSSAPGTKMIMNVSEENTAQWFLKASARIATKRRSLSVRRTGLFSAKYTETGTGSESDIKETRAREDHIKNLPVGQMEILMVDSREGTRYSHLHVRRAPSFRIEELAPRLYPKMHSYLDPEIGVNLRFKEAENRKKRRRRMAGVSLDSVSGE